MPSFPILAGLREEIVRLAAMVVKANARIDIVGSEMSEVSGSAWLYADRIWVTNCHVVADARGQVSVTNRGHRFAGDVIGKDPDTDLAVIRATETIDVTPLELRPETGQLGELCFAVGAPLGEFTDTISMGIVTGLNRRLPRDDGKFMEDMLQTDAAISHGNSGGPLVDIDGRVLGVNSAGRTDGSNIGFTVPSHTVNEIIPELVEAGTVTRATIGAKIEVRKAAGAPGEELVVFALQGTEGPLRPGDILREFNGRSIRRRTDLLRALRRDVINREVLLVVERDGKIERLAVTPKPRPN